MEESVFSISQRTGFEQYAADGNEAVHFRLVRNVEDLEKEDLDFHPSMCHQIFGEGETIFGYKDLKIKIYLTAGSLKPFVGIDYKSKIDARKTAGVEADNILEKLKTIILSEHTTNIDKFSSLIEKESAAFHPPGELIHSFDLSGSFLSYAQKKNAGSTKVSDEGSTFQVYFADVETSKFASYHQRMGLFPLWFIDAASLLDPSDSRWKFFLMFEKYKSSEGGFSYAYVGYSAVYEFYHYPSNIRPRLAQMLILPPFQKRGLAIELLSSIYRKYRSDPRVIEITVEDPSDDFELLRDYVDTCDVSSLPTFSSADKLKNGFTKEMEHEAKSKLKLTTRQIRRIYEILRLRVTDWNNVKEFKDFRLFVKQRLNIPYEKQQSDVTKMMKRNITGASELEKMSKVDDATRKVELESAFQNCFSHYKNVLNRLNKFH